MFDRGTGTDRILTTRGVFTFVSLDANHRPQPLPLITPSTPEVARNLTLTNLTGQQHRQPIRLNNSIPRFLRSHDWPFFRQLTATHSSSIEPTGSPVTPPPPTPLHHQPRSAQETELFEQRRAVHEERKRRRAAHEAKK